MGGFRNPFLPPPPPNGKVKDPLTDLLDRFKALSDKDKQAYLDAVGEFVGGTVGSIAGGAGGTLVGGPGPGTFIGAAAGSGVGSGAGLWAARRVGERVGTVHPLADMVTGEPPTNESWDIAKAAALGTLWEGVGRAVPPLAKAGKALIENAVKKPFQPTEAAQILTKLAERAGIELNIGQRSGRAKIQNIELALDRSPFSTETIRNFRQKQQRAWEDSINRLMQRFNKGEVSQEEFARVAEDSINKLRTNLNTKLEKGSPKAAQSLNKTAVSDVEAGEALKAGREANLDAVSKWASKEYGDVEKVLGKVPVNMATLADDVQNISPAAQQFFAGTKASRYIEAAKNMKARPDQRFTDAMNEVLKATGASTVDELQQKMPWLYDAEVSRLAERGIKQIKPAVEMPFKEAKELRTQLMEVARRMSGREYAADRRAVYTILDNINNAMEGAAKTAAEQAPDVPAQKALTGAYSKLQGLNRQYRSFMEKLNAPPVKGKPGNAAAGTIAKADIPENLPKQVTKSPTMMEGTLSATSPETVAKIGGQAGANPIPQLQRNVYDTAVDASRVPNPAGGTRISPTAFPQKLPPAAPELFGQAKIPTVQGIGAPRFVEREQALYNSPFAKAIDRGQTRETMTRAFPPNQPRTAQETLGLLTETGNRGEAQRGFLENLVESSRTQQKDIGDIRYINPRTLERKVQNYGETVPTVLGVQGNARLSNEINLGKGLTETEAILGNPSGTSRSLGVMGIANKLKNPLKWPGLAVEAVGYNQAARAYTNPEVARWLTSPPEAVMPGKLGGFTSGLTARGGVAAAQMPPMPTEPKTGQESSVFGTEDFIANPQEYGTEDFIADTPAQSPPVESREVIQSNPASVASRAAGKRKFRPRFETTE